jgi:hypothetical protein
MWIEAVLASDLKMTTNYENLQPLWRLENHELCHISSLVGIRQTPKKSKKSSQWNVGSKNANTEGKETKGLW